MNESSRQISRKYKPTKITLVNGGPEHLKTIINVIFTNIFYHFKVYSGERLSFVITRKHRLVEIPNSCPLIPSRMAGSCSLGDSPPLT